ncbi:hypothetical protein FAES_3537 [Fibrella aestuarina BUZ 2]|uniref:Uncharacterized protein n=1 Tax=Fibrella aestuarina BUZ 2 TaxID=1166018 RepID=I0KBP1_9BACT|nr:hypothetical protein FAES_3537 [Fibrella aestuarina BUZ 2]
MVQKYGSDFNVQLSAQFFLQKLTVTAGNSRLATPATGLVS